MIWERIIKERDIIIQMVYVQDDKKKSLKRDEGKLTLLTLNEYLQQSAQHFERQTLQAKKQTG